MSNTVFEKYTSIERSIEPTLLAIESGKVDPQLKDALEGFLNGALIEVNNIVTESKEATPIKFMAEDFYKRVIEARSKLRKVVVKENVVAPVIKTVTIESLKTDGEPLAKPVEPAKPADNKAAEPAKPATTTESDKLTLDTQIAFNEELQKENLDLQKKLKEALWSIEEMKRQSDENNVAEAVEEAIKNDKELEKVRNLLEKANSITEVSDMIKQLKEINVVKPKNTSEPDKVNLPPPGSDNTGKKPDVAPKKNVSEKADNSVPSMKSVFESLHENLKKEPKK